MQFEWNISIGNILAAVGPVVGFTVTGLLFVMLLDKRIALIDQRMANAELDLREMATGMKQLVNDNAQISAISERLSGLDHRTESNEQDIRELRHGRGFVTGINREYPDAVPHIR